MAGIKIYLDHNATTPLHPEVKKTMCKAMDEFGNPSSMHSFGREAKKYVEDSRNEIASFIGADTDEIVFVGSGSEANNTVLSIFSCPSKGCMFHSEMKRVVITTAIEHPCIIESSKCLSDRGFDVKYLGVDPTGKVDIRELERMLDKNVGLVSVMMANNEIGTLQDIELITDMAHKNGALMHTDAVQAVGKIPVDVKKLNVDFLTISGHKIYGPKGIGVLFVRKGTPFCPFVRGGHQEMGRRAGTENTLGIIGLGKAVEMRRKEMAEEEKRLKGFKDILKRGIEKSISDVYFNGHPEDCLAGTLNVSFNGAEGEAILLYLDLAGIAVSTGSACASGSLDPSHVLLATGISPELAHGSIRISMGRSTDKKDVEYVLDTLPGIIKKIRNMSSAYSRGGNNVSK